MALDPVVNFFRSEIATLPLASGGTSMVITTGDGNKLPNPSVDGAFNLTIYNASDPFVTPEIVRCTAKSGDTLTITRAQEGTSATNKTAGATWYVELTPTAKTIQDIDDKKLDVAGGTMTGDLTIPDKIIHSGDTNTAIRFPANDTVAVETAATERLRITNTGNVGIGTTSPATKLDVNGSIRASTGILFGTDTASANTLDDYEEGTWTPSISCSTPGDLSVVYTASRGGRYTKNGREVTVQFSVEFTPTYTTASGAFLITGLPIPTTSDTNAVAIGSITNWSATSVQLTNIVIYASGSALAIRYENTSSTTTNLNITVFPSAGTYFFRGTITYTV